MAAALEFLNREHYAIWLTRDGGSALDPSLRLKDGYAQDDAT